MGQAARVLAEAVHADGYRPDIILAIARGGLGGILANPGLTEGLNVHRGEIFNAVVGESLKLPVRAPATLAA